MLEKFLVLVLLAQVLLTYGVMVVMGKRRFSAAKQKLIDRSAFSAMRLDDAPDNVRLADRNFINQFEIPVLFFAVSICALALNVVSVWFVAFSAVFVITRFAHSIVHLGSNTVLLRYRLYLIGCVMNLLQWGTLVYSLFFTL